jgi:carboxypeptidase family protein
VALRHWFKCGMHLIALIACVYSFAFGAVGQQTFGRLVGQVIGLSGEEVSKAPIEAKSVESGEIFKTFSAANGSYSFTELPARKYEISSPVAGFERKEIEVRAGETTRIDIHFIEIGGTLGTIGDGDLGTRLALYNRPAPPAGGMPRTSAGKPDFSGYWLRVNSDPPKPDMQPWAEALAKYRVDTERKYLPSARCLITQLAPVDHMLVQTPTYLVVLLESSPQSHRLVFLDGRTHPKEPDPTWYGHSVGQWEGDTLVVDRIGFNEGSWYDASGIPHTDMLHLVERYRRPDLGHLEIETTIEDRGAYLRPWTRKTLFELQPNREVEEYVCAENNLDSLNSVGK